MLSVSAAGVQTCDGNKADLFLQMLTEIEEELGLDSGLLFPSNLYLIGVAREHKRAGKPEAYFAVDVKGLEGQIRSNISVKQGIDAWECTRRIWIRLCQGNVQRLSSQFDVHPAMKIGITLLADSTSLR
jgi:hypothetical protein